MVSGWPGITYAAARRALRRAESAADCLPAVSRMVALAAREQGRGEQARANELLGEALAYLHVVSGDLPGPSLERLAALETEARASLLRDRETGPVPDLDDAIECLRRLRAEVGDTAPGLAEAVLAETEGSLARALLARAGRLHGAGTVTVAERDTAEAGLLLASELSRLPPGDPRRRPVLRLLAGQRTLRFMAQGGLEEERAEAVSFAEECLALPGPADDRDDDAVVCHFLLAWLALSRGMTLPRSAALSDERRRALLRDDAAGARAMMADSGNPQVSPEEAEAALEHLAQVSAGSLDEEQRGLLPVLRATALVIIVRAGNLEVLSSRAGELRAVADELAEAAARAPADAPELLSMRAVLLGLHAQAPDTAGQRRLAEDALNEMADRLPPQHPLRQVGLGIMRIGLEQQVAAAAGVPGDPGLDELVALLARIPRDDPDRASLATAISLRALSLGGTNRAVLLDDRIAPELSRAAAGLAPDDPMRPFAAMVHWVSVGVQGTLTHRPELQDQAVSELRKLADGISAEGPARTSLQLAVAVALIERHSTDGDMRHLEDARTYVNRAFAAASAAGEPALQAGMRTTALYLRAHLELVWLNYEQDDAAKRLPRVTAALGDLRQAAAEIAPDNPLYPMVMSELATAQEIRGVVRVLEAEDDRIPVLDTEARDAVNELLKQAEVLGPNHPEYPALVSMAANGFMLAGFGDRDPAAIDRGVALFAQACSVPGLAPRERPRLLTGLGLSLLTRYTRGGRRDPRDLSNAIDRLEEARRGVEQETASFYTGDVLQLLASAYRIRGDAARGDVDKAVTHGLAGLRERAGDVLLQGGDERALFAARRGMSDAVEMARWFLGRGREAAAVGALELSRGIVLHAATASESVAEALRSAGHGDLADEWARLRPAETDTDEARDLRYDARVALEASPAEARLLSPPSVGDIAEALAASGANAFVYLLPRDEWGPGFAVIVDPAKNVRRLPLPGLTAHQHGPVPEYAAARRAADELARRVADQRSLLASRRSASGREGESDSRRALIEAQSEFADADRAWKELLGPLGEWAWRSVVGPLLNAVPGGGRDPRIVLAPGGQLGLVPWHAARDPAGGYACERVSLTYASAARQFVEAARRRPPAWGRAPVLVSDDASSLQMTAVGIRYLLAEHYRAASVFGYAREVTGPGLGPLPDTVPGTRAVVPGAVLAAVGGAGGDGASLLHFGCHGQAELPVLRSRLDLGGGRVLLVGDILRRARQRRSVPGTGEGGGLVVLASCLSDVTNADYDEALTLATAFLSAGASGVVAARWRVADNATALFMAAFHHYLNAGGLSPPQALRAAQRWMLDPGREAPPGLPKALRDEVELANDDPGELDLASPAAWAGFAYQGR